ncbi:hypothetical protein Purlil1_13390 [Purpureocillium lilacinum]|uniref:2EXR domain-containing protein n=1 Tax=Purpureocillium lilacinum TaxID=33203 RepID=A0ABR0BE73_PURLI|nr:hypothetical protein Purlil1_13390 [Purpureocillium lilacinum]
MDLRSLLRCKGSGGVNERHTQRLSRDMNVAIDTFLEWLEEDRYKTTTSSPSSAEQRETGHPSLVRHTATDFRAETISHSTSSLNMPSSSEQRSWSGFHHPSTPAFPFFNRLPRELRMKIWQMAALEGRFFQPMVEPIRLGFADSAVQDQLGLSPSYATFQWTLKPLIVRKVCREALHATKDIAGFEAGLSNTTGSSCWLLHQRRDIVFIDTNMIDKLDPLDLCRIRALGYPDTQFHTLEKCLEVLFSALRYATRCDTIYFCFCARAVQRSCTLPMSFTRSRQLEEDDLVGSYESLGAPPGPVRWGQLRRVIHTIWVDYLRFYRLAGVLAGFQVPSLVGIDVYSMVL